MIDANAVAVMATPEPATDDRGESRGANGNA
jgi:hypothetical protein